MASRPAWDKAGAVLKMTYGKAAHRDALNALYRRLGDLPDDILLSAIERHIDDPTVETSGSLVGNWFPKPAQLRRHANELKAEAEQAKRLGNEARAREFKRLQDAQEAKIVEFPAEYAGSYGLPKKLELTKSACASCRDQGLSYYYIPRDLKHPAAKYRVFEEAEYFALPDTMRAQLQRYVAVCDCEAGLLKRSSAPEGHRGQNLNGRERRLYITIEEVRKMAASRRSKEGAGSGVEVTI